jgi:ubiquinone/menaquinone biosynthesis C-methylase UbiE
MKKGDGWNHNVHYHDVLLRSLPPCCHRALDVGCGDGLLARKLANYCDEVVAIDLNREALANASSAGRSQLNVSYVEADAMTWPIPDESFDCITAVAALHHLPLGPALVRFRDLLKPGGVLAVLGLYRQSAIADYVAAAAAVPVSRVLRRMYGYAEVAAPLAAPTTTLSEIRTTSRMLLPGSVLRRHLLFRYSLVWRKPQSDFPGL